MSLQDREYMREFPRVRKSSSAVVVLGLICAFVLGVVATKCWEKWLNRDKFALNATSSQSSEEGQGAREQSVHGAFSSFESEARRLAMEHFAKHWTQRGNLWYSRDNGSSDSPVIVCRKDVSIYVIPG